MVSAVVLLLGGLAYGVAVGGAGWDFLVTPLVVGCVVVVAGLIGRSRHLLPNGIVLIGWGAAVLATAHVLPRGRATPAYMIGIGVGVAAARLVSRPEERSSWFAAAATTATVGSVAFYLASDQSWLGGWRAWTGALVLWAFAEAARTLRADRRAPPAPATTRSRGAAL